LQQRKMNRQAVAITTTATTAICCQQRQ